MTKGRFKQVCLEESVYNRLRSEYPEYSITTIIKILLNRPKM